MSRPPTFTVKKLIAMEPSMASAIEDFRFRARLKTEADAVRRLLATGIAARPILRPLLEMLERSPEASDPDVQRSIRELRAALGES